MFRQSHTCQEWQKVTATVNQQRLGRFLQFPPDVGVRYEADTRVARIRHVRAATMMGVISYNSYDLISFVTIPDVSGRAVVLRLLITVMALAIYAVLPRLTALQRESLIVGMMVAAGSVPLYLFFATRAPFGSLSFIDFLLTLVFAIVVLQVRFPAAIALTAIGWVGGSAVLAMRPDIPYELWLGLSMQLTMGTLFLIMSSRLMQKSQREGYLDHLYALQRSQELEVVGRSLAELSMTDALTGLSNRRCLDEVLPQWLEDTRSGRASFAFILVDVDHFKAYNDRYGHLAGDVCLREIAGGLFGAIREDRDRVVRYGGEEFAILIWDVSRPVAMARARKLLEAVRKLNIEHKARPDKMGQVTISAGVTLVEHGAKWTIEDIFLAADAALYNAKRAGRARIMAAQPGAVVDVREFAMSV